MLTEHRIVHSQAKQFDVLDLYKILTQDVKSFLLFDGKIHGSDLYNYFYAKSLVLNLNHESYKFYNYTNFTVAERMYSMFLE